MAIALLDIGSVINQQFDDGGIEPGTPIERNGHIQWCFTVRRQSPNAGPAIEQEPHDLRITALSSLMQRGPAILAHAIHRKASIKQSSYCPHVSTVNGGKKCVCAPG